MVKFAFGKQATPKKILLLLGMCLFCESIIAQTKVDNTLINIQNNTAVGKMVVIQYSPDALTRAAITPERLEKLYDYKLTIKDARRSSYLSGFKQVLQNTKIEKSDIGSDSRWGVILFDLKGQRIASIYLDGVGERGYVNSTPVTFITKSSNKGLSQWLNDKFLDVFR